MKTEKKKRFKIYMWAVLALILIFSIGIATAKYSFTEAEAARGRIYRISTDWLQTLPDGHTRQVSLPFMADVQTKEDKIVLEHFFSDKYSGLYLNLDVKNAAVRIYIDGNVYYEDGYTYAGDDSDTITGIVGSGENIIELPSNIGKSRIKLELEVVDTTKKAGITNAVISSNDTLIIDTFQESVWLFVCTIIMLIGITILCLVDGISVYFGWGSRGYIILAGFGLFVTTNGVSRMDIFRTVYANRNFFLWVCAMSIAFLPIMLAGYYRTRFREMSGKMFYVLFMIDVVVLPIQLILMTIMGNDILPVMSAVSLFLVIMHILFAFAIWLYGFKQKKESSVKKGFGTKLEMLSFVVLLLAFGCECLSQFLIGISDLLFLLEMCAFALFFVINSVRGVLLVLADYRERIERAEKEAIAANRAKSIFLSNMSHEIRTPMNAIVGMTDILLREKTDTRTKEYLMNIKSSGDALLTIINDILDFSKIESGKMEIVEEEYEPLTIFHDLSMLFLNRIGTKPVELLYEIDSNMPQTLYGDAKRIRQIIINIVNNAVKFTENGFVKLRVEMKKAGDTAELMFSIQDKGQGIKQEDIGKLFGSFSQVDTKKNHKKEGTGLGLAISKQLVELMGGKIWVESVYGEGSTFFFTIPQKIIEETPAAQLNEGIAEKHTVGFHIQSAFVKEELLRLSDIYGIVCEEMPELSEKWLRSNDTNPKKMTCIITDEANSYPKEVTEYCEKHDIRIYVLQNPMLAPDKPYGMAVNKPLYSLNFCQMINREEAIYNVPEELFDFTAPEAHILIVDDNEMNLKVATSLLEPIGMNIDTAEHGKAAVRKIQMAHYDIVFMDHMMPVMDGIEATQVIRNLPEDHYKTLPIIALSANALPEAQAEFEACGMNGFVAKPIRMEELCQCLLKWLPPDKIQKQESAKQDRIAQSGSDTNAVKADQTLSELPLEIEGIDIRAGIENSGTEKLFQELLGDFYKLIDIKSTKIEKCLADGLIRDYTIEVHALKNTARMIGALNLSEEFYQLEQLGNKEDIEVLTQKTPAILNHYRSYKPILKPFAQAQQEAKKEVPPEQKRQTLIELKHAIDQFDLDSADAEMRKLESYLFEEEERPLLEQLSAYVADVAMEEIMSTCDELLAKLK